MTMEPFTLTKVTPGLTSDVTYDVYFQFDRSLTDVEEILMERHWRQPRQFTSRHKPTSLSTHRGVATLHGTTMEDVRDVHLATMKLVVADVNVAAAIERRERGERERQEQAERDQRSVGAERIAAELDLSLHPRQAVSTRSST